MQTLELIWSSEHKILLNSAGITCHHSWDVPKRFCMGSQLMRHLFASLKTWEMLQSSKHDIMFQIDITQFRIRLGGSFSLFNAVARAISSTSTKSVLMPSPFARISPSSTVTSSWYPLLPLSMYLHIAITQVPSPDLKMKPTPPCYESA